MTRDELMARVELDRADAIRRGWMTALLGVALIVGAAWWIRSNPASPGTMLAFSAGGTVILMALARQLAPRPSYGGGRLEVRMAPIGWVMALAASVTAASAGASALTVTDPFRRIVLLVAVAFLIVMFLANWILSLGTRPVVIIDGDGYHDRRATRGPVPWDQLEPVDVQFVRDQAYYRVSPKDVSRLTWLSRLNALVGFSGFAINAVGLDHGEGDMLLAIQAYRPELIGDI